MSFKNNHLNNLRFDPGTANKLCPGLINNVNQNVPQGGTPARNYCENVACPNLCNQRIFPCATCQDLPFSPIFNPVTINPLTPYPETTLPPVTNNALSMYYSQTTQPPRTYNTMSVSYGKSNYNCS